MLIFLSPAHHSVSTHTAHLYPVLSLKAVHKQDLYTMETTTRQRGNDGSSVQAE